MKQPILVTYRSVTGFTQQYAQWIAEALGGACRPLADLSKDDMAAYGTVIFGGRLGQYKYYDMDKCIEAALSLAESELAE